MKRIIFLIAILFSLPSFSQEREEAINLMTKDGKIKRDILIGAANDKCLEIVKVWPRARFNYNNYKADKKLIEKINAAFDKNIKVKVFFGSWCGDSQYWVPIFFKIVDEAKLNKDQIQYFAVNTEKKIPLHDIEKYDIQYVPTFIFYKDGQEIGRIIETPESGVLEEDLLKIITE